MSTHHAAPTGRAPRRRAASTVAAVLVAALVALGAAACQPARAEAKDRPVLFLHGWAASGASDCGGAFDGMISKLRAQGFTGPMVKVGFYTGDTNCDLSLRSWGSFENGSSWKEVAKAFSKYVYETYTKKGVTVDVVGYSMGGNIARGAVYGASIAESGFSAPLKVEDAVTLGTPHEGAAWYTSFCLWGQCSSLKPGATDIEWLKRNGNPQGAGGTDWTVVGSTADEVTPVDSGLGMLVPAGRKVRYTDVPHTGSGNYMGRADVVARAATALAKVDA